MSACELWWSDPLNRPSQAVSVNQFALRLEDLPNASHCCRHPRTLEGEWLWGLGRVCHSYAMPTTWHFMRRENILYEALAWAPYWAIPIPSRELWALPSSQKLTCDVNDGHMVTARNWVTANALTLDDAKALLAP